ncbi:MAG: DUF4097 family beta strand repeat-containing protein [Vicinamibacterales bacterium]
MTRHLRPILAALLLVAVAAPVAVAQPRETERVDRTIPFQEGGTLRLKNFSGDIRITGAEAAEVTIHAVRRATRERLDRIRLTIETTGSVISINANDRESRRRRDRDNVVETSFEIRVPRRTSLDVNSFSSAITVDDVNGRHRIGNFSGDVRLTRMGGPVRAKTFSGTIRLDAADAGHALDLDTFSGDIELVLPQDAGADIRFNSFSGDIRTDLPITLVSKSRRNLHATLNGGGSDVRVKTFSGDVRLGR